MGDHFVLLVDRLLTESTLEAALESRNRSIEAAASSAVEDTEVEDVSSVKMDVEDAKLQGKLVQCKICHDEDEISNMEAPCACSGSLEYAHRKCIQQWCNHKGNTKCEICLQQYKPGYKVFPQLFRFGRIPMSFRGNWEISRRDLHGAAQIRVVSPPLVDCSHPAGAVLCCAMAILFMILLITRHFLPLLQILDNLEYSTPLLTLVLLRILGIALSIYIMLRAVTFLQQLRQLARREHSDASGNQSDNRIEQPRPLVDRL